MDALYEAGLVKGLDETHYGPEETIKRGDFILLLSRTLKTDQVGDAVFTDVAPGAYYAQAISLAASLGIAKGDGDGTFRPEDPISRQEAMVILCRAADSGLMEGCALIPGQSWSLDIFSDKAEIAGWAKDAVSSLAASDVVNGPEVRPAELCTRLDMAVLLAALVQTDRSSQQAPADYDEVFVIVHTNDVHGYIQTEGKVKAIADYYKGVYGKDAVLTVSAGDVYAGGAAVAHYYLGEEIVKIMDAAGYDYTVPGNNDFNLEKDHPGQYEALAASASYTALAANMFYADEDGNSTGEYVFTPYDIIITSKGSQIGLFGLAMVGGGGDSGTYYSRDDVVCAQDMVTTLTDAGCGTVVGIGHMGWSDIPDQEKIVDALKQSLTKMVEEKDPADEEDEDNAPPPGGYESAVIASVTPELDAFIDGHSHSIIENGLGWTSPDTGCVVTQSGEKGNVVGVLTFYLKDGECVKVAADLLDAEDLACFEADPTAQATVDAAYARFEADTAKPVGETPYFLNANRLSGNNGERGIRTDEQNLGDLVTDAICWKLGAQAAFMGGTRLRASIPEGPISLGDWFGVFANGAELGLVEMTGEDLIQKLAGGVSAVPNETPEFRQVSGVKFSYLSTEDTVTVVDPTIGGAPIDPAATYVVATEAEGGPNADEDADSMEILINGMEEMAQIMTDYMASGECTIFPDVARPDGRINPITEIPAGAVCYEFAKSDLGKK